MKRRDFLKTTALMPFVGVAALPETTQASVPTDTSKKSWVKYKMGLTEDIVNKIDFDGFIEAVKENICRNDCPHVKESMRISLMKRIQGFYASLLDLNLLDLIMTGIFLY